MTTTTPLTTPATSLSRRNIESVDHSDTHPDAQHPAACQALRYDAQGLAGKRMRIIDDLPTNDAGDPQQNLIGHTDVICLDDTPSVFHSLRVQLVGDPRAVGVVEVRQLALYDQQP